MNSVKRATVIGIFIYAGLSFAGWLAMTSRLGAAYGVIFIVCIVGVYIGNSHNKEEETQ